MRDLPNNFNCMEHFEEPKNEAPKDAMNEFRAEIAGIKKHDEETGGPAHLFDVNPDELKEEDIAAWALIKGGDVTHEDIAEYRKKFYDENGQLKEGTPKSRTDFLAFIANKAMPITMMREMSALKEKEKKEQ